MNGPSTVLTPNCSHRAAPVEKGADPKSSDAVKRPLDTDTIRVTGLFVPTGFGEGDEGVLLEQAENPLIEDQPLIEAERGGLGAAGTACLPRRRRQAVGSGGGHTV